MTPTPTQTSITTTPTPTPTVTPTATEPYCCYQYEITNYYNTTQTIFYNLCDGTPTSINVIGNGEGFTLCAQKNSVTFGGNICDGTFVDCIVITRASFSCNGCEITPTPTPTKTATPTKTPVTPTPTPTVTPTSTNVLIGCSVCEGTGWQPYDNDECYRILTQTAIPPSPPLGLVLVTGDVWSSFGTQFFAKGYDDKGRGTVQVQLTAPQAGGSYTNTVWSNPNSTTTAGPLNRCARWTSPNSIAGDTNPPINTWVGFTVCLTGTLVAKTYYVGIAADNDYRLDLDGVEIFNTVTNGWKDEQFKWWHVYPVEIGAGSHILSLYGINYGKIAGFGCEIYDNTLQQLTAATSYSQLNVIYTSANQTQATVVQNFNRLGLTGGWTCSSAGYNYSPCSVECVKYEFCPKGAEPVPTPSPTPTLTPTKRTITSNCPKGTTYKWGLVRTTGRPNRNNLKSTIVRSGNVIPIQSDVNGQIITAKLEGLPLVYKTPISFRKTVFTVVIYDCDGNVCCVIRLSIRLYVCILFYV
jgi:hypothetical protein